MEPDYNRLEMLFAETHVVDVSDEVRQWLTWSALSYSIPNQFYATSLSTHTCLHIHTDIFFKRIHTYLT